MPAAPVAIRSGMGLGDSLYLQAVCRHLVGLGERLEVCTAWPDVFRPLQGKVSISPFRRDRIGRLAHYSLRRHVPETDQFRDCCLQAGITAPVDLRLDWDYPVNTDLVSSLRQRGKPIIVVQLPRAPMDRKDGFGAELLPDCSVIQSAIDALADRALVVQIGSGVPLYKFEGVGVDLANRTSVTDVIDVAWAADAFLGYVSFMVPLSESFNKPSLFVWSRQGLRSKYELIRWLTPKKVLHRTSSCVLVDDCSQQQIAEAANALFEQARSKALV